LGQEQGFTYKNLGHISQIEKKRPEGGATSTLIRGQANPAAKHRIFPQSRSTGGGQRREVVAGEDQSSGRTPCMGVRRWGPFFCIPLTGKPACKKKKKAERRRTNKGEVKRAVGILGGTTLHVVAKKNAGAGR